MAWMLIVRCQWAVPAVCFLHFCVVNLIIYQDVYQKRGNMIWMSNQWTVPVVCYFFFCIVNIIVHIILSFAAGHWSITDHLLPVCQQPIVDSLLLMNELRNDHEFLVMFSLSLSTSSFFSLQCPLLSGSDFKLSLKMTSCTIPWCVFESSHCCHHALTVCLVSASV